jgi:putative DNA-invertase from lambdoid prophage Rac
VTPLRAAIYARVSGRDQHTIPEQVKRLTAYARDRGWKVVATVRDIAPGPSKRPARDELLAMARRREIGAILVWKLDRWGRSVADLVATLDECHALGCVFVSVTEAIDLSTPSGRALAGMLAVFAGFERDLLKERVHLGIAHAKAKGTRFGRPPRTGNRVRARELAEAGKTIPQIVAELGVAETSVRRYLGR